MLPIAHTPDCDISTVQHPLFGLSLHKSAELGDGLTFHDFHGGPSNHKEVCMGGAHMIAAPYATTSDLANI
jgi:hypothetical protein